LAAVPLGRSAAGPVVADRSVLAGAGPGELGGTDVGDADGDGGEPGLTSRWTTSPVDRPVPAGTPASRAAPRSEGGTALGVEPPCCAGGVEGAAGAGVPRPPRMAAGGWCVGVGVAPPPLAPLGSGVRRWAPPSSVARGTPADVTERCNAGAAGARLSDEAGTAGAVDAERDIGLTVGSAGRGTSGAESAGGGPAVTRGVAPVPASTPGGV
jgi:hypothetical protein